MHSLGYSSQYLLTYFFLTFSAVEKNCVYDNLTVLISFILSYKLISKFNKDGKPERKIIRKLKGSRRHSGKEERKKEEGT